MNGLLLRLRVVAVELKRAEECAKDVAGPDDAETSWASIFQLGGNFEEVDPDSSEHETETVTGVRCGEDTQLSGSGGCGR